MKVSRRDFCASSVVAAGGFALVPSTRLLAGNETTQKIEPKVGDSVEAQFNNMQPLLGEVVDLEFDGTSYKENLERNNQSLVGWLNSKYPNWEKTLVQVKLTEDWIAVTEKQYHYFMKLAKQDHNHEYNASLLTMSAGSLVEFPTCCVTKVLPSESENQND